MLNSLTSHRSTVRIIALLVVLASGAAAQLPPPASEASALIKNRQPAQTSRPSVDPSTLPEGPKGATGIDREIADLKRMAEQSSSDAAIFVKLGDRLMQKSRESMDGRLYAEAESAYNKALEVDPKCEDAMVGLAWVRNSQHEFDEGRSWIEKALALNPRLPHAHALLGDAAVELGNYDDGFEHYQTALDIRPDLSSYSRAAHLLWLTGDARKAKWMMQKAIDSGGPHAENTAWCRAELAMMSFQTGALLAAERQAELALKEAPDNPHVLAVMGRMKMAKKEYDAAIQFYQRAIEIRPNHDLLVALGDLYALTGRRDDAEKQYQRVVDWHATGAEHSHRAAVQAHSHGNAQLARFYADHDRNLDDALSEARLAYRDYKNVFVADTLAWCYYKKAQYEEAGKTIRKALRLNTPDAAILFHAGMIHAKLGDRGAAQKFLYRALSLNPQFHPQDSEVAAETIKMLSESAQKTQPAEAKQ